MQMRTRVFVAQTYILIFTICNDTQSLVAVNNRSLGHLQVIQMPILCRPTIAVINFNVATGRFENSTRRRRSHPKIGSIHSNVHIFVGSEIHCAAHFIVMRTGRQTLGTIIESVHCNPRFSLSPGQLKNIRGRSGCNQCIGITRDKGKEQSQQGNHLRQIFKFHNYISPHESQRKELDTPLHSKREKDILSQTNHVTRL